MFIMCKCLASTIKFNDKDLISVYRSNNSYSSTYNTPFISCCLNAVYYFNVIENRSSNIPVTKPSLRTNILNQNFVGTHSYFIFDLICAFKKS